MKSNFDTVSQWSAQQKRRFRVLYLRYPRSFFIWIAAITLALWGLNIFFMLLFFGNLQEAGPAGDSFGSITSLFTGFAFVGLIATLVLQQKELKLQRRELRLQRSEVAATRDELAGQKQQMELQNAGLRKQAFERTFFSVLQALHSFINDISGPFRKNGGAPRSGRDQLAYICQQMTAVSISAGREASVAASRYEASYTRHADDLGPYFRQIYNLLKFVENSDVEDKKTYTDILRAQLSESELVLIALTCATPRGRNLKDLADRYNLLKHLPSKAGYLSTDQLIDAMVEKHQEGSEGV